MNDFKPSAPGDNTENQPHLTPSRVDRNVNVGAEAWVDVPKGMVVAPGTYTDAHGVLRDSEDHSCVVNHHKCKEHGHCVAQGIEPDEIVYAENGAPWCPQCYPVHQNCRLRLAAEKKRKAEVKESVDRLVKKGFLEKLPDGTYKPTDLGREVARQAGNTN